MGLRKPVDQVTLLGGRLILMRLGMILVRGSSMSDRMVLWRALHVRVLEFWLIGLIDLVGLKRWIFTVAGQMSRVSM